MVSSLTQSQDSLNLHDSDKLTPIRHTSAHIMAMAVQKLFPGTKVAIRPVTETGFYYDFDCPVSITTDDLAKIETEMRRIIKANLPIIREEIERTEIHAEIAELNEPYKLEILERIPTSEIITRYFIGTPETAKSEPSLFVTDIQPANNYWWDLCAGPHINFTGEIDPHAFKLLNVAGAYWQGDASGERLGKQIRMAELEKIPVFAIIGKKEIETTTVSVRSRKAGDLGIFNLAELVNYLQTA